MPSLEIIALDTATPQLRAPGAGDTYNVPRDMILGASLLGYWGGAVGNYGMNFNTGSSNTDFYASGRNSLRILGGAPFGINVEYRIGLGASITADVGIERVAAGVLKITDGGTYGGPSGSGVLRLPTYTVAGLPAAATAGAGARSTVSDGLAAPVFAAVAAGGGVVVAPVYCDGAAWRYG